MMCLEDGIGRSINFLSIRVPVTRCALPITSDLGNIVQLSKAKNRALFSTFLPIEAMGHGTQKFIKFIGRHDLSAWSSDK